MNRARCSNCGRQGTKQFVDLKDLDGKMIGTCSHPKACQKRRDRLGRGRRATAETYEPHA